MENKNAQEYLNENLNEQNFIIPLIEDLEHKHKLFLKTFNRFSKPYIKPYRIYIDKNKTFIQIRFINVMTNRTTSKYIEVDEMFLSVLFFFDDDKIKDILNLIVSRW